MPAIIETPLLVIGGGPAALIVATVASGVSLSSLLVGHESQASPLRQAPSEDDELVHLEEASLALLRPHGVLNVLYPYAASTAPFAITAGLFEQVLKHHCVVNMNITVYDNMQLSGLKITGKSATVNLSDGDTTWIVRADNLVDTANIAADLNAAIQQGAARAVDVIG